MISLPIDNNPDVRVSDLFAIDQPLVDELSKTVVRTLSSSVTEFFGDVNRSAVRSVRDERQNILVRKC